MDNKGVSTMDNKEYMKIHELVKRILEAHDKCYLMKVKGSIYVCIKDYSYQNYMINDKDNINNQIEE